MLVSKATSTDCIFWHAAVTSHSYWTQVLHSRGILSKSWKKGNECKARALPLQKHAALAFCQRPCHLENLLLVVNTLCQVSLKSCNPETQTVHHWTQEHRNLLLDVIQRYSDLWISETLWFIQYIRQTSGAINGHDWKTTSYLIYAATSWKNEHAQPKCSGCCPQVEQLHLSSFPRPASNISSPKSSIKNSYRFSHKAGEASSSQA